MRETPGIHVSWLFLSLFCSFAPFAPRTLFLPPRVAASKTAMAMPTARHTAQQNAEAPKMAQRAMKAPCRDGDGTRRAVHFGAEMADNVVGVFGFRRHLGIWVDVDGCG